VVTGQPAPLQPPVESMEPFWAPAQQHMVEQMLSYSFIGSKETLQAELQEFVDQTQVNELMAVSNIFDHEARVHSYQLLSDALRIVTRQPVAQLAG